MTDVTKKSWYNDIVEKFHNDTFGRFMTESPFTWNNNGQKAPLMGGFGCVRLRRCCNMVMGEMEL